MYKVLILLLAAAIPVLTAELPSQYNPDPKVEPVETHAVFKKPTPESEHPVYKGERLPQGRARIEPVRPIGPVIKNDPMLGDQPNGPTDVNRVDDLTVSGYAYVPAPGEQVYPHIPYAPGYGYDTGYAGSNSYDMYGNGINNLLMDPTTSTVGLLWSQVPDSRTLVSYVGSTFHWIFSSIFAVLLGSLITIGVCSYTNLCTVSFNGVGPIHETVRALMSPDGLETISNATGFVKTALDKYQQIQKVTEERPTRRRRSVF